MAIVRLEDKFKSKYKIQLTPERHYISSSSGVTGSVHVFPNRSETQKDNIDERLNLAPMVEEGSEFSGTPIRPFDSNSLEQRRIEIYRGEFNKLIGGAFVDAIQYEYTYENGNWPGLSPTTAGTVAQTGEVANSLTGYSTNDIVTQRTSDGRPRVIFQYDSNGQWVQGGIGSSGLLHRKLPTSDRDRSTLRYDVALGLLLDGANPFTEDHAWRQSGWSNAGNSSYTGTPAGNLHQYQFSGFKIFEDELGIPYLDAPLTSKEEVNAWPPEALLPEVKGSIITNYILKGYSDLSMHPRNKTKKEVLRRRANHDIFSSGSLFQKALAQRMDNLDPFEPGWWVHNSQSLCLGSYTDTNGTSKSPALAYYNANDAYKINWATDKITFEFWIKPCKEQTDIGTIVQLDNSYAIALIPDTDSLKNGVYSKYKLGIFAQNRSDLDNYTPTLSQTTVVSGTGGSDKGGVFVTQGILNLDHWHHVVIRYGADFNNGLLNIFVDSVSSTGGNVDGQFDIGVGSRQTGIFYVDGGTAFTAGDTLFVGGWSPTGGATNLWGYYSEEQEQTRINNATYTSGFGVSPVFQLKSELQELRIWNTCRSEAELLISRRQGLSDTTGLQLYIPFLFDPRDDTPQWKRFGFNPAQFDLEKREDYYKKGALFVIRSFGSFQYNKTQFCPNNAYIGGMPFVNVHSHVREYVNGSYPVITSFRKLTNTSLNTYPEFDNQTISSHKIEYFQNNWEKLTWLRAINSMLVPCDNTFFHSDYSLLQTNMHMNMNAEMLKLLGEGIASTDTSFEIGKFYDDEVFAISDAVNSLDPITAGTFTGTLENLQTKSLVAEGKLEDLDYISPLTTTYAIPQIYYGNRIHPETVELRFILNEDGKEILIKDFEGSLYRVTNVDDKIQAKVGHIDYGNGILCLMSPLLTSNGITNFDLKFKGEKNLHVMQLDVPCPAGVANKSQNPTFKALKATANANETDKSITYISSIYLHDENLNIIGKVNLAQPVVKREEDSFIFRVKVDF